MPFITTPASRQYTFRNLAVLPQWQAITFNDPSDTNPLQRFTTYTGELVVNLTAAENHIDFDFQYPVLGTFDAGGVPTIGISPISVLGMPKQFRSAVANVAVTDFNVEGTPSWLTFTNVAADLYQIQLSNPMPPSPLDVINVVVLSGSGTIRNIALSKISYRVSVLERLTGNPPAEPYILLGSPRWDGNYRPQIVGTVAGIPGYTYIGPLQASGIPQTGL
jgi:hypothetical protein